MTSTAPQPTPNDRMVIALTLGAHDFLGALISRALEAGLVAPDELVAAASVWDAYRTATRVSPPPPPTHEEESHDADSHA